MLKAFVARWTLSIFLVISFTPIISYADKVLIYPKPRHERDMRDDYPIELLKLALERSEQKIEIVTANTPMQQQRALWAVENGLVDIMWTMMNQTRESYPYSVPFDIYQGIFGNRLILIHQDQLAEFSKIEHPCDFYKYTAIMGHDWPDTRFYLHHGLPITTSSSYESLFNMLLKGHGDYFPRSVSEIFIELEHHTNEPFVVEPNWMIVYKAEMRFILSKQAYESYGQAILKGLNQTLADGSFNKLFEKFHGDVLKKAQLNKRKWLNLDMNYQMHCDLLEKARR
ncbi:hypothetical protein DS2_14994 [Catenovulum agarivorans DS-2]|uniref:Solute-binding protein family 3/N-terminal domain-containing protein n=1 Tax=Catenovulum agarivorans DS-2 TaxID=1328313 RepID=W7QA88_9ALTE|nr:hypothetical protein [Catenovulum agarivorans]EWH08926.1 hypothetical protein DS2_14994 [Catenovulum agarivorans DS-2]